MDLRDAELLGDLDLAQVAEEAELENPALALPERAEGPLQERSVLHIAEGLVVPTHRVDLGLRRDELARRPRLAQPSRDAERPGPVAEMVLDLTDDRGSGEGTERDASLWPEAVDGLDEPECPHLDEVLELLAAAVVAVRERSDERHVLLDQPAAGIAVHGCLRVGSSGSGPVGLGSGEGGSSAEGGGGGELEAVDTPLESVLGGV